MLFRSITRTGLILSEKQMAHEIDGGDIVLMKTRDGVIEFKPHESFAKIPLDVTYAIDPKDEKALLARGKRPRDLNGNPMRTTPRRGKKK